MDRKRHINTRNLVVCETFDDFAAAVNNTDFIVEDCVGYVVSLASVLYWNNVETVWGAIGFTWTYTEDVTDDEAIEFPHPYYRIKHVEEDGTTIEMGYDWLKENKMKRGYGVFNSSSIPFTHIPPLPDGYRIIRFNGSTIQNIISDVIYIDKSDWRNLTNIDSLCNSNKTIYADFDGAPITTAYNLLDGTASCKLYLKADLSGLPKNGKVPGTTTVYNLFRVADGTKNNRYLITNDYYKNLNIFIGEDNTAYTNLVSANNSYYGGWGFIRQHPILRWEGAGDFKFEYFFHFKNYLSVYTDSYGGNLQIDSANAKYYLNNFINYDDSTDKGLHFKFADRSLRANTDTIDLTIDCTNGASDVRLDYDLTYRHSTSNYTNGRMYPIKYIGNVTSIGTYNPYLQVENDEWPEFEQNLVDKLNPSYGEYIMEQINCIDSICPYTIDMTGKIYFHVLDSGRFTFNDTSRRTPIPHFSNMYYYNVYPTLMNTSQNFSDSRFTASVSGRVNCILFPLEMLKTDTITFREGYYFRSGTKIEFTRVSAITHNTSSPNTTYIENSSIPVFKIKGHESINISLPINNIYTDFWGYMDWYSANNETNLFEIDATKEQLMAGVINTYIGKTGYVTTHPIVICNASTETDNTRYTRTHYTNFQLIYRANVKLAYSDYTDDEYVNFVNAFEPKGDTTTNYTVRLKDYMTTAFERLGLDVILTNKGYNIVTESS